MKQKLLVCILLLLSNFSFAQDVDSLLLKIKTANDSVKTLIYCDLADLYLSTNTNLAINYADSAIAYSQHQHSDYQLAFAYRAKGQALYKQGNYETAILQFEEAKKLAIRLNNPRLLYLVYSDIGNIYSNIGKNETALNYYNQAIINAQKINNNDAIALLLVNIADLYYAKGDYKTIEKYYDSALSIATDIDIRVATYNNLAYLQYSTGKKAKAHKTFANLIDLLEQSSDNYIYSKVLNTLIRINITEGDLKLAEQRLKIVDSISEVNSYNDVRVFMYQNYHDLYMKIGDYEQSCYYLEEYEALNDSIYSFTLASQLSELENKHVQEKLNLELLQKEQKMQLQRKINIILIVIAIVVIISALIVLVLLRQKTKLNRKLHVLNKSLQTRDEEINCNLRYARQVQLGCMQQSQSSCARTFVLDLPKTVVGGDFYINITKNGTEYFFLGDCTGHGVSGGFLSVLAIETINIALDKFSTLPEIASWINDEFYRVVSSAENLVGESLCLSIVSIKDDKMQFLSSKHKMWQVSDGQIVEHKQHNPIMGFEPGCKFICEEFDIQPGIVIFISSDGYPDQFGNNNKGKLKYQRFRDLLCQSASMQPNVAKDFLHNELTNWRGDVEQTDDVLVVGIYF